MITRRFKNKVNTWSNEEKFLKVTIDPEKSKFNTNYRKENNFYCGYKVINFGEKNCNGDFVETIDVRFYYTNSACYCCLWINVGEFDLRGTGRAGGYGYDRKSSAFEEAINNAGIFNFPRFGGSGNNTFALKTLCKVLNIKKYQIVEIFG